MTRSRGTLRRWLAAVAAACILAVLGPGHVEPQAPDLVGQGRQALDADRVDEALALFERAVAADAKNAAALAWLGSAQVRKAARAPGIEGAGWVKRGFDTLDEAVERFPDAFVVYVVRGGAAAHVPDLFRKADAAVSQGLCAVDVLGVWGFRGTNAYGGKAALADWEAIALNGREAYIAFDSDVMVKREVHAALVRLKAFLEAQKATIRVIYLTPGPGGVKQGLDDFLAAGHSVADLLALATDTVRAPEGEDKDDLEAHRR